MEEYMESELFGIFRVKLVTKNIVRGSPGTQFMHMRVKTCSETLVFPNVGKEGNKTWIASQFQLLLYCTINKSF